MEQLNKVLTKHIDKSRFPGIQWQINIRDQIYSGKVGYNNIETKETVLDNTIYRIWSMTKPVVAIAALQLLEKNKLNLDDLITKYLPEFSKLKVLKDKYSKIDETEELKVDLTIKDLFLFRSILHNLKPNLVQLRIYCNNHKQPFNNHLQKI